MISHPGAVVVVDVVVVVVVEVVVVVVVLVEVVVVVVVAVVLDVVGRDWQTPDSSPLSAIAFLFFMIRAALLVSFSVPVGVPVQE